MNAPPSAGPSCPASLPSHWPSARARPPTNGPAHGRRLGANLSGTLAGGGATSQEKAQAAWRAGFQGANPDVTVNYDPVGSGNGRENFICERLLLRRHRLRPHRRRGRAHCRRRALRRRDVIQVPAYVSPIAVVFNLDGVDSLNLSAEMIAKIFDGKITKWNDPAIAADNPDVDLPDLTITPVHRPDDSGTTENFTEYLSGAGEGAWTYEPDGLWPERSRVARPPTAPPASSARSATARAPSGTPTKRRRRPRRRLRQGGRRVQRPVRRGCRAGRRRSRRAVEGAPTTDMAIEVDRATTEAGAYPVLLVSLPASPARPTPTPPGRPGQGLPELRRLGGGPAGRRRRGRLGPARRRDPEEAHGPRGVDLRPVGCSRQRTRQRAAARATGRRTIVSESPGVLCQPPCPPRSRPGVSATVSSPA